MYKIGEFSKIVNIPIRTLRFYDDCGVLQPDDIDRYTGYRYYTDENVVECELVKLLKSVNFTLEEIALVKDNIDETIIEQKQEEIKQEIRKMEKKVEMLSVMKNHIKKDQPKVYKMIEKIKEEKI